MDTEPPLLPCTCQTCQYQPLLMRRTDDTAGRCELSNVIVFDWDFCTEWRKSHDSRAIYTKPTAKTN